jgi:hypothetical protein
MFNLHFSHRGKMSRWMFILLEPRIIGALFYLVDFLKKIWYTMYVKIKMRKLKGEIYVNRLWCKRHKNTRRH